MNWIQGTMEAQIDRQLSDLALAVRRWENKMQSLIAKGISFRRAAYIVDGSPLGKATTKRVKLWFIRRRNQDRKVEARLKRLGESK